jgi:hypothetical protein
LARDSYRKLIDFGSYTKTGAFLNVDKDFFSNEAFVNLLSKDIKLKVEK